jgi:hypothetical protein
MSGIDMRLAGHRRFARSVRGGFTVGAPSSGPARHQQWCLNPLRLRLFGHGPNKIQMSSGQGSQTVAQAAGWPGSRLCFTSGLGHERSSSAAEAAAAPRSLTGPCNGPGPGADPGRPWCQACHADTTCKGVAAARRHSRPVAVRPAGGAQSTSRSAAVLDDPHDSSSRGPSRDAAAG